MPDASSGTSSASVDSAPDLVDQAPRSSESVAVTIAPAATATVRIATAADESWRIYAQLTERIARIRQLEELCFSIANEVWQLFPYGQAFVWQVRGARPMLRTISGLARVSEDSPFVTWLRRFGAWLKSQLDVAEAIDPSFVQIDDLPAGLRDGWREWMPELVYVQPIVAPERGLIAFAAYAVDVAPDEEQQKFAIRAFDTYGAVWSSIVPPRATRPLWRRSAVVMTALIALAALFVPVRLSVLAPAEIVGLDAVAITAPMDGVVARFAVTPNQAVVRDQLLYTLDDTTLRNRREVAVRQLGIARADALAAAQKSFASEASRAELASLNGKVAEKQAELDLVNDMLARVEVRAPSDGIAVFADVNDWLGKPVTTGERVVLLANPAQAGVLVWLPVPDAINLETGAELKMYLQIAPLSPLSARLFETSYQAVVSPLGVQSYRLRARFDATDDAREALRRIGLKGTAKIYGEKAMLGYYLFRRPLAALRRSTGF